MKENIGGGQNDWKAKLVRNTDTYLIPSCQWHMGLQKGLSMLLCLERLWSQSSMSKICFWFHFHHAPLCCPWCLSFFFPSGVQVRSIFAGISWLILMTCPSQLHLLFLRISLIVFCLVTWSSWLWDILFGQKTLRILHRHEWWKVDSLLISPLVSLQHSEP